MVGENIGSRKKHKRGRWVTFSILLKFLFSTKLYAFYAWCNILLVLGNFSWILQSLHKTQPIPLSHYIPP